MEVTTHDLISMLHGVGFGALFMLAFSGALTELYRLGSLGERVGLHKQPVSLLPFFLVAMAVLSWTTVFSGSYIIYPWYRAVPPLNIADLIDYPRRLLLSNEEYSDWHNVGMEWKEHVAWLAPMAITMLVYIITIYGRAALQQRTMRTAVMVFTVAAFVSTAAAGGLGILLKKYAPVRGGATIIHLRER